jgi:hypothetical protein
MMKKIIEKMCVEYQRRFTQNMRDRDLLLDMERLTYRTTPYMSEIKKLKEKIETDSDLLRDLDLAIYTMAKEMYENELYVDA